MIIPENITKTNPFYKICEKVDTIYNKFSFRSTKKKIGRPRKYSDLKIIKCQLYRIMNSIFCLRELEWKLNQDRLAQIIIGLEEVPDHSTFCIRLKMIEQSKFYKLYKELVQLINPDTRICSIDSTALRSTKFDTQAKNGFSSRLNWYHGYKLHLVSSNDAIPLVFKFTTANVYDSNCQSLIKELKDYNIFVLLGDAAYDSVKLFELARKLEINLLTEINLRKGKSEQSIKNEYRKENRDYLRSPIGRNIYKQRMTIERLFSLLKERYNLENPRLYGCNRYQSHVMWTLLLYLIEKLLDIENGTNDNKFPWNR